MSALTCLKAYVAGRLDSDLAIVGGVWAEEAPHLSVGNFGLPGLVDRDPARRGADPDAAASPLTGVLQQDVLIIIVHS